jgi:hypothetical protein
MYDLSALSLLSPSHHSGGFFFLIEMTMALRAARVRVRCVSMVAEPDEEEEEEEERAADGLMNSRAARR